MGPLRNTVLFIMASSSVLVSGINIETINTTSSLGCPVCTDRNIFKEITKKTIKDEILRKLGLSSPPSVNVTGNVSTVSELPHVQQQIKELKRSSIADYANDVMPGYHNQFDDDDYHFQPRSITILPARAPLAFGYRVLYFKLPSKVTDSRRELEKAELSIHLPAAPSSDNLVALIRVYHVFQDKNSPKISSAQVKAHKVKLRTDAGGRVDINVTRLMRIWQKRPEENLGLVVKALVVNTDEELEIGAMDTREGPYLTIDIHEGSYRHRSKRTTNRVCSEEMDQEVTQCCMWPLTIDFDEFGWDWVLFPKTYEANFCSGDCSLGQLVDSNHASLLQHLDLSLSSGIGPCCSGKKMSDISMLYLDKDKNVVLGKLPSMKVERCGCS